MSTVRTYISLRELCALAGRDREAAACAARRGAAYDPLPCHRLPNREHGGKVAVVGDLLPWLERELGRGAEWCRRPLEVLETERRGQLMPDFITQRRAAAEMGTSAAYFRDAKGFSDPVPMYELPGKARGRVAPVADLTEWLRRNDGAFLDREAKAAPQPKAEAAAAVKEIDALRLSELATLWGRPAQALYEARRRESDPLPAFQRRVPGARKPVWFADVAAAAEWAARQRLRGGLL